MWLLLACTNDEPKESEDTGDSGDSGQPALAAGPECTDNDLQIRTPFNVLGDKLVHGQASDEELYELQLLIDDFAPFVPGPWSHSTSGPMLSEDGLYFEGGNRVLDQASVPELVIGPDGSYWLFFIDGNLERLKSWGEEHQPVGPGLRGFGGLEAAVSEDGVNFERVELTVTGELPLYMVDPDIVLGKDGIYRLYYLGILAEEMCADTPDPFLVPGPHQVYLATSVDLVNWEQQGIVFTSSAGGTDPAVWCVDANTCYITMLETGISTDGGLSFSNAVLDLGITPLLPDVHRTASGWRMYSFDQGKMMSHASEDGFSWDFEQELSLPAGSPTALELGATTWLYLLVPREEP
jgi:hypothetical protein